MAPYPWWMLQIVAVVIIRGEFKLHVTATEGDAFTRKIQISPEMVNTWSENILEKVFNARHRPILNKLNNAETLVKVQEMRSNLIQDFNGKPEAQLFSKLSAEDYLSELKGAIKSNKNISTVAMMVGGDKIFVAGNINSVDLPLEPTEKELFKKVAMKKEIIYLHDTFGLQDSDAPFIRKAIEDSNVQDFFANRNPEVLIVRPQDEDPVDVGYKERKTIEWEAKVNKLTEEHQKSLDRLTQNARKSPTFTETTLHSKIAMAERKFQRSIEAKKVKFDKDVQQRIHNENNVRSEMQLLHEARKNNLKPGKEIVIGASKSLCENCQLNVNDVNNTFDYAQHDKPGLAKDEVKLFEKPPKVSIINVNDIKAELKFESGDADHLETNLKSVDISGCRRRKRSGSSSCAKLNSEQFVKEYAHGDELTRSKLAEATKTHKGIQIDGSAADLKKVNNLVKLEGVKARQKATIVSKLKTKDGELWETIKSQDGKIKTKMSPTKVAKKINTFAYTSLPEFSRDSPALSTIGIFLLGKSFINGIIHKDYTSLGILGGRIGIEVVGKSAGSASFIGKAVGPIGLIADVGLSTYSLSKAVDRLKAADNKYDKNDAIADIVLQSADIAITTISSIASFFPPAAPIAGIVANVASFALQLTVSLYKTQNEINRINSEVPLLGFEKAEQFSSRFFDWFGTRKDDYVDDLVKVKKFNDLAVQHNLEFLKNNSHLSGIAFPARSIAYSGGCRVTRHHCPVEHPWGCLAGFEPEVVLATGCDHGVKCDGHECTNDWKETGVLGLGYDEYRCTCDGSSSTNEGHPRLNNYIDFRTKQSVYLERAVPAEVNGANFKCRPGHLEHQGFRISKESKASNEYLCKGTIALYQYNFGGSTFYFDLEEGIDTVYLNENSDEDNIFIIENGYKNFVAAKGKDSFIIQPNCTDVKGTLHGGWGDAANSIIISDDLLKGYTLTFENGVLFDQTKKKIYLTTTRITEVMRRKGQPEIVSPSCDMTSLRLQGGQSNEKPDVINLSFECKEKLSIIAEGSTNIKSTAGNANVQIQAIPGEGRIFHSDFLLKVGVELTIIAQHGCSQLQDFSYQQNENSNLKIQWKAERGGYFVLSVTSPINPVRMEGFRLLFHEGDSYSFAHFQPNGQPLIIHSLDKIGDKNSGTKILKRKGAIQLSNIFQLRGGNWEVVCGKIGDRIILFDGIGDTNSNIQCKQNQEGANVISFGEESKNSFSVDFVRGMINENLQISGISSLEGRALSSETVICGCDTEFVATLGGSSTESDVIVLPDRSFCSSTKNLTIMVEGNTKLVEHKSNVSNEANTRVSIVAMNQNSENSAKLDFFASTHEDSKLNFEIFLETLTLRQLSSGNNNTDNSGNGSDVSFLLSEMEQIRFNVAFTGELEDSTRVLNGPSVFIYNNNSEHNGILLFNTASSAQVLHQLENRCKAYQGIEGVGNYFKLFGNCWFVEGAKRSVNTFIVETKDWMINQTSIRGGEDSIENTLIVESLGEGNRCMFNFKYNWFGLTPGQSEKLENIQNVYGRSNNPDTITTTCESSLRLINGRGGAGRNQQLVDKVLIGDSNRSCEIQIVVPESTQIQNTASRGRFIYDISLESGLDCVNFLPSQDNQHILQYRFLPYGVITGAKYSEAKNLLELFFSFNLNLKLRTITMKDGTLNPTVRFVNPGEDVTCELKAENTDNDIKLLAQWEIKGITTQIEGLSVSTNVFIVNITGKEIQNKPFKIAGGVGSKARNEYWLVSTPNEIELISNPDSDSGTNTIHLLDSYYPGMDLIVDLQDGTGSISTNNEPVVNGINNINKFYGRPSFNETVVPGCQTDQIYFAEKIVLNPNYFFWFYLDMVISSNTMVEILLFEDENSDEMIEPQGEFRYHFQHPRSFTPSVSKNRYKNQFLMTDHIYHLPFNLNELSRLEFYLWNDTLVYNFGNSNYYHQMLVLLDEEDEFYRQPKFFTNDDCELKVGRIGDILAICNPTHNTNILDGNTISMLAVHLEITIIYKTLNHTIQAGNNRTDERNMFTTSKNVPNHFYGGGGKNTIYEITYLQEDVLIVTGEATAPSSPTEKHTIDLTDIIVPLRTKEKNKYVPKVERKGDDLIVSFPEYKNTIPGKITIYNGVKLSGIFQILLNSAVMEFQENAFNNQTRRKRSNDELNSEEWVIFPKPILIEPGSVYSISQEDLEDGHKISLGEENVFIVDNNGSFGMAKSDEDLVMSNIENPGGEEQTIIIISDFYQTGKKTADSEFASNIEIQLPGLAMILEKSVLPANTKIEHISWDEVLERVEEILLEDIPEISRVFRRKSNVALIWGIAIAVILLTTIAAISFMVIIVKRKFFWVKTLQVTEITKRSCSNTNTTKEDSLELFELQNVHL